jgi:hypothetical protein
MIFVAATEMLGMVALGPEEARLSQEAAETTCFIVPIGPEEARLSQEAAETTCFIVPIGPEEVQS